MDFTDEMPKTLSVFKKSRKLCAHLCWTVSAKYVGVNFTFPLNDLFCIQVYDQEGVHCDLAWTLCTIDDLILVYLMSEIPFLIVSCMVSMRRQKRKYIAIGTWILLRENKDAYNFSVVFCDKEKPLVPKNSHYCVNCLISVVISNDNTENWLIEHFIYYLSSTISFNHHNSL